MDQGPNVVRVRSSFARPRGPLIIVGATVVFLALALVKPWSFGGSGSSSGVRPPAGLVSHPRSPDQSGPLPVATIADPNAMSCNAGDVEQLLLIERWPGNEVRDWIAVSDAPVSGPLDFRITKLVVFSSHVVGLGICGARSLVGGFMPAARIVDVQSIGPTTGGSVAVDLGAPASITIAADADGAAVLFGPPEGALSRASQGPPTLSDSPGPTGPIRLGGGRPNFLTWATGSYAIAFIFPSEGPNVVRWLRIDLRRGARGVG